jgi:hypothetical protein
VLVLLLAAAAGFSHSTQCALTEFQRMLFLNYVLGTHDTVAERPERLSPASEPRPLIRVLRLLHRNYCVQQRLFLRSSDALERQWETAVAENRSLRPWFAGRYRAANEPMLRWWPLVGPNAHKVGLVVIAFLVALYPEGPGMVLYLMYDAVILNVVMVALVAAQGEVDRQLAAELAARP